MRTTLRTGTTPAPVPQRRKDGYNRADCRNQAQGGSYTLEPNSAPRDCWFGQSCKLEFCPFSHRRRDVSANANGECSGSRAGSKDKNALQGGSSTVSSSDQEWQYREVRRSKDGVLQVTLRKGTSPTLVFQRKLDCSYGPVCRNRALGCPFRHQSSSLTRDCSPGNPRKPERNLFDHGPRGQMECSPEKQEWTKAGSRWQGAGSSVPGTRGAEGQPPVRGNPRRRSAEGGAVVSRYPAAQHLPRIPPASTQAPSGLRERASLGRASPIGRQRVARQESPAADPPPWRSPRWKKGGQRAPEGITVEPGARQQPASAALHREFNPEETLKRNAQHTHTYTHTHTHTHTQAQRQC